MLPAGRIIGRSLRDAFTSSNIYFELARLAGAVPEDATDPKDPRYKAARQAYKSCHVGLVEGLIAQEKARSRRLFEGSASAMPV